MSVGYLLVGHGTRGTAGCAEFLRLADRVRSRAGARAIEPAFLELAQPTIADAVDRLHAQGVNELTCVPVILLAAGHVKRDIPSAVRAAAQAAGIETVRFTEHVGAGRAVVELSQRRYREVLAGSAASTAGWVLVGRGTRDEEALAEIRDFQSRRERQMPTAAQWLGFLAMAQPTLNSVLRTAAESPLEAIIVQPHLLFEGELLARSRAITAEFAAKHPEKQWLHAEHLGPHESLAEAIAAEMR